MASIKNDEHQHQSSTNDPREVEEKLCQLMEDNLQTTANDPTEAEKQPHQPDSSPPLDGPPTDSSSSPDDDNKTNEEVDEPSIQAKEATGLNNDPSPSPNDDNKTDKRADGEADESTTPAKDETKPADEQLSQSSEDESNSPEPDPSETKADRLRRERRAELDDYIERDRKDLMPRDIWQMEQDFRRTDWQACATDPSYQPPVGTELELSEAEAEELQRQEREWCRSYEENMKCEDFCGIPDEEWLADLKAEQTSKTEAADESTTPAKGETKPDDQPPQPSENEPNSQICPSETKADRMRRERRAQLDEVININRKHLVPRHIWKMEQDFRLTDWQAYARDPFYEPPYTPLNLSESEAEELRRQERVFWEQKDLPFDRYSGIVSPEYEEEGIIPNDDWFYDPEAEPMTREEARRYYEQKFRPKTSKGYEDDRNITAVAPNEAENSLASDQIRTDPLVPSKL
ncbi:hypothetical protein AtubIFM57258_002325 [Aspergillus tubingensis]|nr:hypothetical protein AtubIFM57258_002325 [Aspergillus tubingensis]